MCLILLAHKVRPDYPLILAANRDEFYERPTSRAHFWKDFPDLLAGRDRKYGGTWMGMTRTGRFGAVTNFRDRTESREHPLSRGLMVKTYLTGEGKPEDFIKEILPREQRYNGFNLIVGDPSSFIYYSNRSRDMTPLKPGVYGLSNHLLDTPWPKVTRSRRAFIQTLEESDFPGPERFFEILSDRTIAGDEELPDTGFGIEWERILSSPFIVSPTYGTRASTVLLQDSRGHVTFVEKTFAEPGDPGTTIRHEFTLIGR